MLGVANRSKASGYYVDLEALSHTQFHSQPFPHIVVPNFIRPERLETIVNNFPDLASRGNYLPGLCGVSWGPMKGLLGELRSTEFRDALAERLRVDLEPLYQLITLRGKSGGKDGSIHTDSKEKVVSAVIYPNIHWGPAEGSLRILRSASNINDFVAEIPPQNGNMVAFVRSENSFHGYLPYVGPRRIIQLHWLNGLGRYLWDKVRLGAGTFLKKALKE